MNGPVAAPAHRSRPRCQRRAQTGLSLVELMIGVVLGMLVVAGVLSMYLSTSQSYRTNENLSRIQENGRIAFELMAYDIREAGFTPCGNNLEVVSALRQPTNPNIWWNTLGLRGYDGTQAIEGVAVGTTRGARAANTSAIQIGAGRGTGVAVESHNAPAASFSVNTVNHGLNDNDIVMVCDNELASIFQVTNASPGTNVTIFHNESNCTQGSPNCPIPGNATKCLGNAANCALQAQNWKSYARNGIITTYSTSLWYVGCTGRGIACDQPGGRSLFRIPNGARNSPVEEIVTDVDDMQLLFLRRGQNAYVPASSITANQWNEVTAVRIALTLTSPDRNVATNAANQGRLTRTLTHTVALRNRVP